MNYLFQKFYDCSSFSSYLETAKTNKVFQGERLASNAGDDNWTGTRDYQTADSYLREGDTKNSDKLIETCKGVKIPHVHGSRPVDARHVAGYRPNVAAYIMGQPKTMWKHVKTPARNKVVNVMLSVSCHCGVSATEKINVGIKMAYVVIALERQGYRVNLWACSMAKDGNDVVCPFVRVKSAEQPLNIRKLVYPLVNPSFFRRHGFRFIETVEGMTEDSWPWGYGYPITEMSEFRKYIEQSGIKYDVAITHYEVAGCCDADEVLQRYFQAWNQH